MRTALCSSPPNGESTVRKPFTNLNFRQRYITLSSGIVGHDLSMSLLMFQDRKPCTCEDGHQNDGDVSDLIFGLEVTI